MNSAFFFSNYFLFIIWSGGQCSWLFSSDTLVLFSVFYNCTHAVSMRISGQFIRYAIAKIHSHSIQLNWFGLPLLWFALLIFLDIFVLLLYYRCCCCCCCCRCWYFFVIFFISVFLFAASLFAACFQLLCWLIQKCTIFTSTVTVQQRH